MFSSEMLIEIFKDKEVRKVPFVYQTIMIHAIEKILETPTDFYKFKRSDE